MQLHRSSGRPDWAKIPADKQNTWQRLAQQTNGVLTPGNLFTASGFALVIIGLGLILRHDYWVGLLMVAVGRLFDIFDGLAAEATGTKSPLGEKLDAGLDKLASVAAFVVLVIGHILPLWAAILLLVPNLSNAALTVYASRIGFTNHPNQYGKISMALSWLGMCAFVLAAALYSPLNTGLSGLGAAFTLLAFGVGLYSSYVYAKAISANRSNR